MTSQEGSISDKIQDIQKEGNLVTSSSDRPAFDRRQFLTRGGMAMAATAGAASLARRGFAGTREHAEHAEVTTAYGRLRGLREPGLLTFLGVPYGGAVAGANRFRAAPPLQPWTGVRVALTKSRDMTKSRDRHHVHLIIS